MEQNLDTWKFVVFCLFWKKNFWNLEKHWNNNSQHFLDNQQLDDVVFPFFSSHGTTNWTQKITSNGSGSAVSHQRGLGQRQAAGHRAAQLLRRVVRGLGVAVHICEARSGSPRHFLKGPFVSLIYFSRDWWFETIVEKKI